MCIILWKKGSELMHLPYFTLLAPLASLLIAQGLKPLTHFLKTGELDIKQLKARGGLPSSHTAAASSLAWAVGLREGFSASLFAIAFIFSLIVAYDAMNVRYFAGENIRITKKLINDLANLVPLKITDTDYQIKLKEVLGHTEIEVVSGYILGLLVAAVLGFCF